MADKIENALLWTFLVGLFTCVQRNKHLLSCYTEDERRQMPFSSVLLTFYSIVIFRVTQTHCQSTHMTPPGAALLLLLSHFHFPCGFLLANISSHLEVLYTYAVGREYFKIFFFFKPKTNSMHMRTKSKSATGGRPRNRGLWKDATCYALTYWDSGSWQWSQARGGACEPPECRPALSESAGRNYFTAVNYMRR